MPTAARSCWCTQVPLTPEGLGFRGASARALPSLGIGVCFSIRILGLAMLSADRGAQLLMYPGAPDLWRSCRARALESAAASASWGWPYCVPSAARSCWCAQVLPPLAAVQGLALAPAMPTTRA